MATAGMVGPISKFNFQNTRVVSGMPEEFIGNMADQGGAIIDLPQREMCHMIRRYINIQR